MIPELNDLIPFLLASISLTVLPGPDNLFVLSLSIIQGAKMGIPTALGMAVGNFAHTTAVALGLSAIILHSPTAFSVIQGFGVAYLLYLAWQSWRHPLVLSFDNPMTGRTLKSGAQYFKRGVLMNLLNPKVALFFLAFFPQFVDQDSEYRATQIFLLGTVFVVQTAIIFSSIALAAGRLQPFILSLTPRLLAGLTSALFASLAVFLALSDLSAT